MLVEPLSARYTLKTSPEGLSASIPARRNWFVIIFLCAWLGGWFFGEISAIKELLNPKENAASGFLAFWLVGWTLGGIFCFSTILWQLAGREILTVNASALVLRIEIFGLGWNRTYRASEIKNLRATDYVSNPFTNQRAFFPQIGGSGHGPIAFDYGARTIRVASSLDESEARILALELSARLPRGRNAN